MVGDGLSEVTFKVRTEGNERTSHQTSELKERQVQRTEVSMCLTCLRRKRVVRTRVLEVVWNQTACAVEGYDENLGFYCEMRYLRDAKWLLKDILRESHLIALKLFLIFALKGSVNLLVQTFLCMTTEETESVL